MRRRLFLFSFIGFLGLLLIVSIWLTRKPVPEVIFYGLSFNTIYATELGLDWREVYDAFLDDLSVRRLRLAAHWPMIEPSRGQYNFDELDYQIERAEAVGAEIVLAVGRRLPRWPECHIPIWARELTQAEQAAALLTQIEAVVNRYADSPAVTVWQVENEPFLGAFAREHCGPLDRELLDQEIALVRSLDPTRPILITDSGNLGRWAGAYKRGDIFGTSVYVHFWHAELGQFRTILPALTYRFKEGLMRLVYGEKETILIELAAEPWLLEPIVDTPIEVQLSRMDLAKLKDVLIYAEQTRYDKQYLWGGEWWYWLKQQGYPEMWEFGRELFQNKL